LWKKEVDIGFLRFRLKKNGMSIEREIGSQVGFVKSKAPRDAGCTRGKLGAIGRNTTEVINQRSAVDGVNVAERRRRGAAQSCTAAVRLNIP